jgi:addiction module RelE/StbE family toxin
MEVIYHSRFLKLYSKMPIKVQGKFEKCIVVFQSNPFDERLRNHPLQGKWQGFRSLDVTGDYRAVYLPRASYIAEFFAIGTHSQLYG